MNGTEVNPRYSENALKEKAFLQELNKKPPLQKFFGYCKLSGPGFMNAAFTLGAGSFASSVTSASTPWAQTLLPPCSRW